MTVPERQRPEPPDFHSLIREAQPQVRGAFVTQFAAGIAETAAAIRLAYDNLIAFDDRVVSSDRAGLVERFLLHALDSVLVSTRLLVEGLAVPSGNMMRHYGEASATALLMSHSGLGDFERWQRNQLQYSVRDAPNRVNKKEVRRKLGISEDGWRRFLENTRSYDDLSHASMFSSQQLIFLSQENTVTFGGDYDPGKLPFYRLEVDRRRSAAEIMSVTITACTANLGLE